MPELAIPYKELAERYPDALLAERTFLIAAGALLVGFGIPLALGRPRRVPRWLPPALLLPFAALAVWRSASLAWVADDAFISYRYAKNLVAGHGLVWNPGEHVEGYTNFLWTMLSAIALALRLSPVEVTLGVSLLSYAAALFLTTRLVSLLAPKSSPVLVSFAAIALAGNYVMHDFGTSGLETMTAACMVLLMLERATVGRPLAAGAAGIVATLLHPDHLLFYAALGATYFLDRDRWRALFRYALPLLVVYAPYFLWRTVYYGDLFPNTYYAKAGNLRYYSQGQVYLVVNWFATSTVLALPFALYGLLTHLRTRIARFAWLGVPVYLLWIAKIGGDFMVGRLFVPVLPTILILAELGARRLIAKGGVRLLGGFAAATAVLLAGVPVRVLKAGQKEWQVADERTFYELMKLRPVTIDSGYFNQAKLLERVFVSKGLSPYYATGCVGMIGFVTGLPILDTLGLNDKTIARKPIGTRGRPGHEKAPTPGDVLPRGADFSDLQHLPKPYDRVNELKLDQTKFYLMTFDNRLLDGLKGDKSVHFTDARVLIDRYNPLSPNQGPERRACDAWFYGFYYFAKNDDPERRSAFLAKLVAADPVLAGVEDLVLADPPEGSGWSEVSTNGVDNPAGWTADGAAFRRFPTKRQIPRQETVGATVGPYANSFDPELQDEAHGKLISEPFTITGDAITLLIGGGNDIGNLRASLVVDGRRVADATGCDSEVLGRRVWNVAAFRGKTAIFEIVDTRAGSWAHILVDQFTEWRRDR